MKTPYAFVISFHFWKHRKTFANLFLTDFIKLGEEREREREREREKKGRRRRR